MRTDETAAILGVVGHEVLEVREREGWWEALVHHGADHTDEWRRVRELPAVEVEPVAPRKTTPRKAAS